MSKTAGPRKTKRRGRDPEAVLREFREMLRLGRVETTIKDGKVHDSPRRWRLKGSSGADYAVTDAHPLDYHLKVAEDRYKADLGKIYRESNLPSIRVKALQKRMATAENREAEVLRLARDPWHMRNGKPIRKRIAETLKISYSQVCRILKKIA